MNFKLQFRVEFPNFECTVHATFGPWGPISAPDRHNLLGGPLGPSEREASKILTVWRLLRVISKGG